MRFVKGIEMDVSALVRHCCSCNRCNATCTSRSYTCPVSIQTHATHARSCVRKSTQAQVTQLYTRCTLSSLLHTSEMPWCRSVKTRLVYTPPTPSTKDANQVSRETIQYRWTLSPRILQNESLYRDFQEDLTSLLACVFFFTFFAVLVLPAWQSL